MVLNYIESLGCSEELSLKLLTFKTVFLLAITRPSRSVDLCSLDIKRIQSHANGVSFLPIALAKQSRQGKRVESFFFPSFSLNTTLCPVSTLQMYLERTAPLRGEERKLFISFIKPHKAATSSLTARWLRLILENAGINSAIFGAHFTRGASVSAAFRAGITTSDILQAANWSSESVFQKFYHKEVDKAAYGRAVITQNSSKSATNNTVDVWDWAFWYIILRMAKTTQWLQAILDYMKKVMLSTSTVHTHPPIVVEELIKGQRKWHSESLIQAHGKWADGRYKHYESSYWASN